MKSNFKYTPLPTNDKSVPYCSADFLRCALCSGFLVLFAFTFCIVWSILYNFDESTRTHCNVFNFLPSISAAIGSYSPQKHVWRISIFIHVVPRFFIQVCYYKYFKSILLPSALIFIILAFIFNYLELFALLGLTNWSSDENYPIHKFCFLTFILMSNLYMVVCCFMLQKFRRTLPSNVEALSLRLKWKLFIFNISSFLFAGYCFMRHMWYCEPGGYGPSNGFIFLKKYKNSVVYIWFGLAQNFMGVGIFGNSTIAFEL